MDSPESSDDSFAPQTWDSSSYQAPQPPTYPKFPTLAQLAEAPPEPKRRQKGLFEELLAARPEILLQDARENPDSYDSDALEILQQMYDGQKKIESLTQPQQQKLDEATMEFMSATPAQKAPAAPVNVSGVRQPPQAPALPKPIESPMVDAFWWAG